MTGEIITTIVGNLGEDPELRFTPSGAAVAKLSVANTPRTLDRNKNEWVDGEPTWVRVTVWRNLAENIAGSLRQGDRVICYGPVENRKYEDKEGNTRYSFEMNAWSVGPDLAWVTAPTGKGVHEGAKERKKRPPREDAFENASTERPASQSATGQPTADTQRAAQGPPPEFAQTGAASTASTANAFDDL